jgi:hypothetical protein
MSTKRDKKQIVRDLLRLLRGLSRDHAYLLSEEFDADSPSRVHVYTDDGTDRQVICTVDIALVRHCLAEELLIKTKAGWCIGSNGRLALKRMLAGAEPFAEQHQQRKVRRRKIGEFNQKVLMNDRSSPLGWLSRRVDADGRAMISKLQFSAGERLARDFQFAGLTPRITSSWTSPGPGGQKRSVPGSALEISDNRLAARQRVRAAIDYVGGDLAGILLDICCFQIGLGEVEKKYSWPRRSGKIILQIALDRLADHYGMSARTQSSSRDLPISHWGSEGYKPSL